MLSRKLTLIISVSLVLLFVLLLGVRLAVQSGGPGLRVITERRAVAEAVRRGGLEDEEPYSVMPGDLININTADAAELQRLPGIGAALAEAVVAWRAENGPFGEPEELMKVPGIGAETFAAIAEYIVTGDTT